MNEELLIRKIGEATRKRMRGDGWKLQVYKGSMGWTFRIFNGPFKIHPNQPTDTTHYFCLCGYDEYSGLPEFSSGLHADPNDAVWASIDKVYQHYNNVRDFVIQIDNVVLLLVGK